MRDAAAQVDRLDVGELGEPRRDHADEAAEVLVELLDARAGAEVGVNRDDRQLGGGGARAQRAERLVPDAVLRRRAAGVARLDVAVAEAGVHAHGDRAGVARAVQLVDHAGRADVRQHAVLEHDRERVVAQDVGGQHHHRRLGAHREAGAARAQDLVAAHGVDPEPGGPHRLQHLPAGVGLHRVAGLQRVAGRQRGQRLQPAAQLGAVVEIERRSDLVGEAFERVGGEIERRHRRELSQMRPLGQRPVGSAGLPSDSLGEPSFVNASRQARGGSASGIFSFSDSSAAGDRRGSTTVKAAPAPSALETEILPPSALQSSLVIQSPRPEARVLALAAGPLEPPEDPLLVLGGDPDAVIAHDELRRLGVAAPLDLDDAAGAVLDGVADHVGDDLIEARLVPQPDERLGQIDPHHAGGGRGVGREPLRHLARQRRQVDLVEVQHQPPGGQAGHVQHPVDEAGEPARLARAGADALAVDLGELAARRVCEVALDRLDLQQQRGERRAQLVRGDGQELVARGDGRLGGARPCVGLGAGAAGAASRACRRP